MSLLTKGIGLAKKAKHRFQDQIRERTPVYLSPVRRIEQVAIRERICAMTFDDGPCGLPASPDRFRGKALTQVLAETLERYGARGTFDVVGDTSANYPDRAGKHGSASWGGVAYDHYPDFGKDGQGGVVHCPELVSRLLAGGHEITSHTYSHVLFGWKPLVYGRRKYLQGLDPVVADLKKLHHAMEKGWGYAMRLGRPPHYVDGIKGGFTSYDAYALMGYQYMAASFDGAGWLPLASYEAEVEATWRPMERLLLEDPDAFRGQIIFQKDGYNMAKRTPVAFGLRKQLELLNAVMEEEYQAGNYVIVGGDFNHALGEEVAEGFPSKQRFPAWVSVLTQKEMAEGITMVRAKNELDVPTCRGADIPYTKGVNFTTVVDGFLVSDNVEAAAENVDTDFGYSDHNPVLLRFRLLAE